MSFAPATTVLDSVLFRDAFGTPAMRQVFSDQALIGRYVEVEVALAKAEARCGVVPVEAADTIAKQANASTLDFDLLRQETDNVGYPILPLVHQIAKQCGDAGRYVHWGATTQDIMDTATVLQIRDGLALIRTALRGMVTALSAQADKHRRTVMAGRTHLQQALPITLGLKCAVWAQPLIAHIHRLDALRPRVQQVSFAGAAGTLASLGDQGIAVMEGLATELDLAAPAAPWHVSRDGFAETVAFLGLICGSLAKLATDVILLAQTEVGELAEPYVAGRGSSSTMPQKRNPIASEYILAAARTVHALVPVMLGAMAANHERATGPWQAELLALPQAFVLTHGALQHAGAIAEGMVIDAPRMRRNLDLTGGLIVAEAVMMGLAPHIGRGEAHHVVKHACDAALAETIPLADALAREPAIAGHLDRAAIDRLTDPAHYLGSSDGFIDRVLRAARALD